MPNQHIRPALAKTLTPVMIGIRTRRWRHAVRRNVLRSSSHRLVQDSQFIFVCNEEERNLPRRLSKGLSHTESDTVCWLMGEAVRERPSPHIRATEDERDAFTRNI